MKKKKRTISQADKQEWMLGLFALIMTSLAVLSLRGELVNADRTHIEQAEREIHCIMIDPGHGGKDPGKIGIGKQLEKEINLEISLLLKQKLEEKNIHVVISRTEDTTATGEVDSNKGQDMNARIALMEKEKPDVCVSIHQNSFPGESVKGAQVFYYSNSKQGEELAQVLQETIAKEVDPDNNRKQKPDSSYYILVHSPCPTVIVECGFLSNYEEATKLSRKDYQEKLAQAICNGILAYFGK